jgi:hypothetical protein
MSVDKILELDMYGHGLGCKVILYWVIKIVMIKSKFK